MLKANGKSTRFCLVAVLCTLFLLPCCGRKGNDSVTFFVGGAPAELDFWQELVAQFEKQTGIRIDLFRQPTDTDLRRQGLVTPLRSGKSDPDVLLMDVAWLAQFAASDWLEPLDAYLESSDLNLQLFFRPVLQHADRYEGKLVALPVYVDGGLLYYRKDLLDKYKIERPPQTWQRLVEQAQKVQSEVRKTNPDFFGFVWQGAQYEGLMCTWLEFASSNNGGIELRDREITLCTGQNIQATEFMRDLIDKYQVSPPNTYTEMKEEQVRMFFQQGNALFERNWPYAWALHQSPDSPVKGKVGIAPLPHFAGGKTVSTLGGWHIGISTYADAKRDCFKFLEFILSYDVQKQLALKLGWNPSRKDVYSDPEVIEKLPHFTDLKDVFENLRPRPNVPYYTLLSEVLQRNISSVLSGQEGASQALSKAQTQAQAIIEKYEHK